MMWTVTIAGRSGIFVLPEQRDAESVAYEIARFVRALVGDGWQAAIADPTVSKLKRDVLDFVRR